MSVKRIYALVFLTLFLVQASLSAVPGEILEDDMVSTADSQVLKAEAQLFETIGQGIALLLAQCEGTEICEPAVNIDELERIIQKLDTRITDINRRIDATGEEALEEVVDFYTDTHAEYSEFIDRLDAMMGANWSGDRHSKDGASNDGLDLDIFEDADEAFDDEL